MILAGGRASRLPGKLIADAGAVPLVVRVLRNVRDASNDVVISSSAELEAELRALVDVPVVVDAEPARGPLGGLLTCFATMRSERIFAVAGDAPFVDAAFARRLDAAWRAGDEAVVPVHAGAGGLDRREPLAALYDRAAFVREGTPVARAGRGSLHAVIERLRARFVRADDDPRRFTNVNTPDDYAALRARLAEETA